jgi:DNA-binding beta-propeller fold protein YncE
MSTMISPEAPSATDPISPVTGRRWLLRRIAAAPALGLALLAMSPGSALAHPATLAAPPTIKVGSEPSGIVISPTQSTAYVANSDSVSVVSLVTHRQLAEVGTGATDQIAIGLVRGGGEAYVPAFHSRSLTVFDTTSLKVTGSVKVGLGATEVVSAQTSSGEYAYVPTLTSEHVAVIRTSDNKLVKTIKLPNKAQTAATTTDGHDVWVGSAINGTIWVIDTADQRIVRQIAVSDAGPVSSIAFSSDGTRAWVYGLAGVSVVDVANGNQLAFVPITRIFPHSKAPNAGPIALTSSGRFALAVNSTFPETPQQGTIAILNTRTLKVRREVNVGTEPTGLALDNERNTAYVTNYVDGTLSYFRVPK